MNSLDLVISVCASKDLRVWSEAAPRLLEHIASRGYLLIVPDCDVGMFQKSTPAGFQIAAESAYTSRSRAALQRAIPQVHLGRMGWYLQQFIKLEALRRANPDDICLLWDSDTVPLRKLQFVRPDGVLRIYKGWEYHAPYFAVISELLGMARVVDFSFVAQCLPIRGRWAHEFFDHIEQRHGRSWIDAILSSTDMELESGFSEYEMLGTFLSHRHADAIAPMDRPWDRFGNGLLGDVRRLRIPAVRWLLARRYDFMSFERWDPAYWRLRSKVSPLLPRSLKRYIKQARTNR